MTHRIYKMPFASVYPHYVVKVEKKGRSVDELHEVITWLTGYDTKELERVLAEQTDFERFFAEAPQIHPNAHLITGVICGVRIEEIQDPLMRNIRYLDKLVDELAKGKKMEKILRQ
ncbi:MAG: DUF2200 domain-containing protein [Flavobacteriales bacterium]